jgi:CelD/BcsL family acetyltransferase involved in cellulose biosynthesis
MSRESIRVDVLSRAADLRALLPEWSALYERDPRATPFSDPNLLLPFHAMFVPHVQPRVIIARSADGALRGVLPLGVEYQRVGPIFLRKLQSLISWHAVFPDAVVDAERAAEVLPALARALNSLPWESMVVTRVREDAWLLDSSLGFLEHIPQRQREAGEPAPQVALQPDRPLLPGRDGRELRRTLRRLEELGTMRIGWEAAGTAGREATVEFVAMHGRLKTYQRQTRTFTFGTATRDFPDWLADESGFDRAGLFTLRLNGRMLAGCVVLRAKARACPYRAAWELDVAKYGVGVLLLTELMAACRAAGDLTFELGPGREPYKNKWQPSIHQLTTLRCTRPTWRRRATNAWLRARGLA